MKWILICVIAFLICFLIGFVISRLIIKRMKKQTILKYISFTIIFGLLLSSICTFTYLSISYKPKEDALNALKGNDKVKVSSINNGYYFDGKGIDTAFIFYPGAKVQCEAYSPIMLKLAENGIDCFLTDMPFNFALFGENRCESFLNTYNYNNWLIGGHSMGGLVSANYVSKHIDKIKGLIITHAHEDHIGGVPYLLKTVKIPVIYGSLLVQNILKRKLKEHPDAKIEKFVELRDDLKIETQHFKIDFFRVCHSIPLCFGVCLQTPNGNVVTCGDFRFDFSDKMEQTNIHKICDVARRGVDLLLCETTNAEAQGFSTSEKYVLDEIRRQISKAPGRVFITTFASNLRRIQNVIEIAINLNRRVCIIGKTMDDNIRTSINTGLLKTFKTDFVEPCDIKNTPDNELVIILTEHGKNTDFSLFCSMPAIMLLNPALNF